MATMIRLGAAVALAAAAVLVQAPAAAQKRELPAGAAYGDYAVGAALGFAVDDGRRFDPWNTAYGSPEYRALLRRVEAAGQPRTVLFHLWYPAKPAAGRARLSGPRTVFPAASGRRADRFDFYFRDEGLAPQIAAAAQVVMPQHVHLRGGGTLAEAEGAARQAAAGEIRRRILGAMRGAWLDAEPAEGKFPLVLLAHGLGGNHGMWSTFGDFLASHGYVVAAPTFISDGGLPLVFHDPDSRFARRVSAPELRAAYETILGEVKVLPYFYRLVFGRQGRGWAPPAGFDPAKEKIVPGGVARATGMMRNLFRQRVADVGLVLRVVRTLGAETEACRVVLESMGASSAARELCGRLDGRIDGGRVGIAGHSLGSMTAQLASNHLPGIAAAVGFNNGPPFTWTPEEMFGAGPAREGGLPVGSRKPLMVMIGDEDAFVQRVFSGFFQSAVAAAGGDPAEVFPLAPERALPDRMENPQPVALSAWRRAVSDRVLAIVRDTDHSVIVEDLARLFPWPEFQRGALPFGPTPERRRKPTGKRALGPPGGEGERFALLDWAESAGSGAVYWPHAIRDWYALAWFDWHVKGDRDARARIAALHPFGALVSVRKDLR